MNKRPPLVISSLAKSKNQLSKKGEDVMKQKLMIFLAAVLFALGCEGNFNPVSPDMDTSLYSAPCAERAERSVPPGVELPCRGHGN